MTNQFVKDAIRTESPNFYMDKVGSRLLHASMGFVTEAGEFQDALKKSLFYGEELDRTNLKEEIGDMLWYMAIAMDELGTGFDEEQDRVIRKLKKRFPSKFEDSLAEEINRDRKAEREILETDVNVNGKSGMMYRFRSHNYVSPNLWHTKIAAVDDSFVYFTSHCRGSISDRVAYFDEYRKNNKIQIEEIHLK